MRLTKMMIIFLISFPILFHATTLDQLTNEIQSHYTKIKTIKADFSISTAGTGNTAEQKGTFSYSADSGTDYKVESPGKVEVLIKNDGSTYINGQIQKPTEEPPQMGDLFLLSYLNRYNVNIEKEDSNFIQAAGYERSNKPVQAKLITVIYNKNIKAIEKINYKGGKNDFPYIIKLSYTNIAGIPVLIRMNTVLSAFSVSISSKLSLYNIQLETK